MLTLKKDADSSLICKKEKLPKEFFFPLLPGDKSNQYQTKTNITMIAVLHRILLTDEVPVSSIQNRINSAFHGTNTVRLQSKIVSKERFTFL